MARTSGLLRLTLIIPALACLACASHPTSPAQTVSSTSTESSAEMHSAPTSTEPGPSPQEIKAVIGSREHDVRQCYIAGTFKDSQLSGTVSVTFTIETSGAVSGASDSGSNLPDPEVVECVIEVFSKLEFRPGGSSPTEVTYPINFGSRG